ncbi:MAG: PQQ-binding-like beta-propeller repeat protein [Planctomycetota bacterium]|jgi:outer membrane protein assembly factor BamB
MRWLVILLLAVPARAESEVDDKAKGPPFEWRQLHGSAANDNYRERKDEIVLPHKKWHAPGARGVPSVLVGRWLYCGGDVLGRHYAKTGKFHRSPKADARAVGETPVVTDDRVIVRRPDGTVQAYSLDLSKLIWEAKTKAPAVHADHPAAAHDGFYVINAGNVVHALRIRDGKDAWKFNTRRGEVAMTPAIGEGKVFFGSVAGGVWALELKSGRQLWFRDGKEHYGWSNPMLAEGLLLIADRGVQYAGEPGRKGLLHAIDPKSGKARWSVPHAAHWVSSPAHAPGIVALGTGYGVVRFNLKTGGQLAPRFQKRDNAYGGIVVVGSTLYTGSTRGRLVARDARNGQVHWNMRFPHKPPRGKSHVGVRIVHTGTQIYAATASGLYCLEQDPQRRGVRPQGETIELK